MVKKLISKPVAAGIRQTEELIQTILDGKADVFHAENAAQASTSQEKIELRWSLLQTLDEWGFSNASIRYRWWYLDRPCLLD